MQTDLLQERNAKRGASVRASALSDGLSRWVRALRSAAFVSSTGCFSARKDLPSEVPPSYG